MLIMSSPSFSCTKFNGQGFVTGSDNTPSELLNGLLPESSGAEQGPDITTLRRMAETLQCFRLSSGENVLDRLVRIAEEAAEDCDKVLKRGVDRINGRDICTTQTKVLTHIKDAVSALVRFAASDDTNTINNGRRIATSELEPLKELIANDAHFASIVNSGKNVSTITFNFNLPPEWLRGHPKQGEIRLFITKMFDSKAFTFDPDLQKEWQVVPPSNGGHDQIIMDESWVRENREDLLAYLAKVRENITDTVNRLSKLLGETTQSPPADLI